MNLRILFTIFGVLAVVDGVVFILGKLFLKPTGAVVAGMAFGRPYQVPFTVRTYFLTYLSDIKEPGCQSRLFCVFSLFDVAWCSRLRPGASTPRPAYIVLYRLLLSCAASIATPCTYALLPGRRHAAHVQRPELPTPLRSRRHAGGRSRSSAQGNPLCWGHDRGFR